MTILNFRFLACNIQELLDEEKAEMVVNQMKERSTRSFNFGAYHPLETVGSLYKQITHYSTLKTPTNTLLQLI